MSFRHIVNIMNFLNKNPKLALYVKNFNDEKTGFILCPHEEIKEIREGVLSYGCHSKTRFAIALKACQLILRGTHTLEDFMTAYDQKIVAYETAEEEEEEEDANDAEADADVFFDYRHEQALEKKKQRYLEEEGDKSDNQDNGNMRSECMRSECMRSECMRSECMRSESMHSQMYHPHNYSYYS